jgi:hypothetical protein
LSQFLCGNSNKNGWKKNHWYQPWYWRADCVLASFLMCRYWVSPPSTYFGSFDTNYYNL